MVFIIYSSTKSQISVSDQNPKGVTILSAPHRMFHHCKYFFAFNVPLYLMYAYHLNDK